MLFRSMNSKGGLTLYLELVREEGKISVLRDEFKLHLVDWITNRKWGIRGEKNKSLSTRPFWINGHGI